MEDDLIWAPEDSDEYRAFRQAVIDGDIERVKATMKPSIDINAFHGDGGEGRTVLHEAAREGHVEIIRFLLAHGADINVHDRDQINDNTPLINAARVPWVDAVRVLLDAGADINARSYEMGSVLHAVLWNASKVDERHVETINLLLDRGLDINDNAPYGGGTVLKQAVLIGDHELIEMLIGRGSDVEGALAVAAECHKNTHTLKFLLDRGIKDSNWYALSRAAVWGKMDMAKMLLAYTDEPICSKSGEALNRAAGQGHLDMLDLLIDRGFNVNARNENGQTPLLSACDADKPLPILIQTLLDRGANIAARLIKMPDTACHYQGGDTPLHALAWRSSPEAVELLLRAGADVTIRNDAGETPLIKHASQLNSHGIQLEGTNPRISVLKLLLDADSDINATDFRGRTALHSLAANRFLDIFDNKLSGARLLLARGINALARDNEGMTAADLLQEKDGSLARLLAMPQMDLADA